jgi:hypothetical protein
LTATAPQFLGSELHISQGLEVNTWNASSQDLRFSIGRPGRIQGKIWVSLPLPPQQVTCNGTPAQFELSGMTCCIQLDTQETAGIQLDWGA